MVLWEQTPLYTQKSNQDKKPQHLNFIFGLIPNKTQTSIQNSYPDIIHPAENSNPDASRLHWANLTNHGVGPENQVRLRLDAQDQT
jgi:hypothetical protein